MLQFSRWSVARAVLVTTGLAAGAIIPSAAVFATSNTGSAYPDTQGHWAQPFIKQLTEQQILTGYPDGTFQPERPVDRDEFAAVVRQAFNQAAERQIASGSVYSDVPQGYWAAPAIEEAYQMGFMQGYPDGNFRPNQGITRAEVLVSLAKNLNLTDAQSANTPAVRSQSANAVNSGSQASNASPLSAENTAPQASAIVQPNNVQPNNVQPNDVQPNNVQPNDQTNLQQPTRSARRRPFAMYPMAMTTLMQPFVNAAVAAANPRIPAAQAQASTPAAETPAANKTAQNPAPEPAAPQAIAPTQASDQTAAAQPQQALSFAASNYYADANQIPQYAIDSIARATQAGIVVNYPETNLLHPNRPATRGEVAAFIHQALVDQGRLQPLPSQTEAANFVVKPQ